MGEGVLPSGEEEGGGGGDPIADDTPEFTTTGSLTEADYGTAAAGGSVLCVHCRGALCNGRSAQLSGASAARDLGEYWVRGHCSCGAEGHQGFPVPCLCFSLVNQYT